MSSYGQDAAVVVWKTVNLLSWYEGDWHGWKLHFWTMPLVQEEETIFEPDPPDNLKSSSEVITFWTVLQEIFV